MDGNCMTVYSVHGKTSGNLSGTSPVPLRYLSGTSPVPLQDLCKTSARPLQDLCKTSAEIAEYLCWFGSMSIVMCGLQQSRVWSGRSTTILSVMHFATYEEKRVITYQNTVGGLVTDDNCKDVTSQRYQ